MKAYRYEDCRFLSSMDELCISTRLDVILHEFPVVKQTAKGFWIEEYTAKRFVRAEGRKRFACLTKSDALASFVARKSRQVKILETQLRNAEEALSVGQTMLTLPTNLSNIT